jgi:histidinol-phosphatase (PHP family)
MGLSVDLHIHSTHSVDGRNAIDEMCQAAIATGLEIVCFTERLDMNPEDMGFGFFNFEKYSADIELAMDKYGSELTVLKGIEFSEPHLYRNNLKIW